MHQSSQKTSPILLVPLIFLAACSPGNPVLDHPSRSEGDRDLAHNAAELDLMLPELLADARIAGLSLCLISENEIAHCGAYGVTDAESGQPVEATTLFQAASLSKPVFAYTVLRLVDQGVIELDKPLLDYIGETQARKVHLGENFDDPRARSITPRMVLSHTSGFPNWRQKGGLEFIFDPGEKFGYSGEGFGLLQKVVERLSGTSLEELVTTLTFEPLGMVNSTFSPAKLDFTKYAWPHDMMGVLTPRPADLERRLEKAKAHAAATLLTTAPDYARFVIALMTGSGLEPATHRELLRPQVEVDDEGTVRWGLGVGLEQSGETYRVWHWGDNDDSKAFFVADPERGDGLVFFANSFNGLSIVGDLLEISMSGPHPLLDGALLSSYPAHDSADFRFSAAVYAHGAEGGVALIRQLQKEDTGDQAAEAVVNRMGYWLLGQDRVEEAILLFELNVELYPDAWNVYDSLGEAQLEVGLRHQGLTNYRRSLELNPENDHARMVLAEAGEIVD
jgi:CubicO group peptidase (beta-lactamase class C family)